MNRSSMNRINVPNVGWVMAALIFVAGTAPAQYEYGYVWDPVGEFYSSTAAASSTDSEGNTVWGYHYKPDNGGGNDDNPHDGVYSNLTSHFSEVLNSVVVGLAGEKARRRRSNASECVIDAGINEDPVDDRFMALGGTSFADDLRILSWTAPDWSVDGISAAAIHIQGTLRKDDLVDPGDIIWSIDMNSTVGDPGALQSGTLVNNEIVTIDLTNSIAPGDTIYLVADHVNGSGASRYLRFDGTFTLLDARPKGTVVAVK